MDRPGDSIDALVMQIVLWRDDNGVRARLTSDATGQPTMRSAASLEVLLRLVDADIRSWANQAAGLPPATDPRHP